MDFLRNAAYKEFLQSATIDLVIESLVHTQWKLSDIVKKQKRSSFVKITPPIDLPPAGVCALILTVHNKFVVDRNSEIIIRLDVNVAQPSVY